MTANQKKRVAVWMFLSVLGAVLFGVLLGASITERFMAWLSIPALVFVLGCQANAIRTLKS